MEFDFNKLSQGAKLALFGGAVLVINLFRAVLADAQAGSRTDAVKDLIDRFVLVGVPDRYMPER